MPLSQPEIPQWVFIRSSLDCDDTEIEGIKIWKHDWKCVESEIACVKDPHYGQSFRFAVYRVQLQEKTLEFAAGEFSNGIWGFYTRNRPLS